MTMSARSSKFDFSEAARTPSRELTRDEDIEVRALGVALVDDRVFLDAFPLAAPPRILT
jgi:hypothetical protein